LNFTQHANKNTSFITYTQKCLLKIDGAAFIFTKKFNQNSTKTFLIESGNKFPDLFGFKIISQRK
jgi:hypothetical protein